MLNTDPTKHVIINSGGSFLKCLFQQQIYKYNKLLFDAFLLFANLHHFLTCAHTFSV